MNAGGRALTRMPMPRHFMSSCVDARATRARERDASVD